MVPTIGRHEIEDNLGHGSIGIICEAVDPEIGRVIAIKTIRLDQKLALEELEDLKRCAIEEAQVAGSTLASKFSYHLRFG